MCTLSDGGYLMKQLPLPSCLLFAPLRFGEGVTITLSEGFMTPRKEEGSHTD